MKCFSFLVFLFFISCDSQSPSKKLKVEFEDVYHHYFTLAPSNFMIIDSQEKMKKVYAAIYKNYGGKRSAPIPSVTAGEKYVIIKPALKNSNDVEIEDVEVLNKTLYITVKPFQNPEVRKTSRLSPNVLMKIYTKSTINKVIINTQNK